jgi:hypothetical protein
VDARMGVSAVPLWQRRRAGLTFTRLDLSIDGSSIRFTLKNWVSQGRLSTQVWLVAPVLAIKQGAGAVAQPVSPA